MTTKRLPDSLKEASEFILSNITDDTFIPLFTKSGSTEVMRKIKANVLNNGGGGGSTESLIPKHVIYINPEKDEVEGECYKTFSSAKLYMESNTNEYFRVELPAGEFGTTENDYITLSNQWEIHGNNTKIVAPIDSNIIETGDHSSVMSLNRSIQNCEIQQGFLTTTTEAFKCFHVYDCTIMKLSNVVSDTPTTGAVLCFNCSIDTGDESDISAIWYVGFFMNCFIKNINAKFVASGMCLFVNCMIMMSANTHNGTVSYFNCVVMGRAGISAAEFAKFENCSLYDCNLYVGGGADGTLIFKSSQFSGTITGDRRFITLKNSSVDWYINDNVNIIGIDVKRSSIINIEGGEGNYNFTVNSFSSDATSDIKGYGATIVLPAHNANIVYSSDGGVSVSNITNEPSGETTHLGICKDLTQTSLDVFNYMWFPMNI